MAVTGLLNLSHGHDFLELVRRRVIWHEKAIRYSPTVREQINHLRQLKRESDEEKDDEFPVVFQTDIQHVVMNHGSRVIGPVERSTTEAASAAVIHGPMRGGGTHPSLKVWAYLSDDESELLRVDQILLAD
jgi:hypothetical protein